MRDWSMVRERSYADSGTSTRMMTQFLYSIIVEKPSSSNHRFLTISHWEDDKALLSTYVTCMASFVLGFQEVVTTQPGVGSALSDSGPALSEDDAINQSGTYVTPTSFRLHQL